MATSRSYQRGGQSRTVAIAFRVSKAEKNYLEGRAEAAGQSVSDYVRDTVLEAATATPERAVAAAAYLSNTIPHLEAALTEARAFLDGSTKE